MVTVSFKSVVLSRVCSHLCFYADLKVCRYVPYGKPIADTKGDVQTGGVDATFCQKSLSDTPNLGTLTICDAPGPGMARIYNAGTVDGYCSLCNNKIGLRSRLTQTHSFGDLDKTSPMGWDSGVGSVDVAGAIRGSINSWAAGDFGYDASNPYNAALSAGQVLSPDQIASLSKLQISEETAGLFNIPVCQMFDLRFFPPASGSEDRLPYLSAPRKPWKIAKAA